MKVRRIAVTVFLDSSMRIHDLQLKIEDAIRMRTPYDTKIIGKVRANVVRVWKQEYIKGCTGRVK